MSDAGRGNRERNSTRRDFLKRVGVSGAALGLASLLPGSVRKTHAGKRDFVLIGHPNPSTGPISDFGEASPWAGLRALEAVNREGGVYVEELGRKVLVRMKTVDTESDPTRAADAASKLILHDEIDLMVVMHTPDTVNPVAAICERFETPCISLDAPVEAWLSGGPFKWTYHAFWTADSLADLFIGMWDQYKDRSGRVVGGFWPNDADGKAFSEIFAKKLPERGYAVVDPGRFPFFTRDYGAFVGAFKKNKVDIVTGVIIPPDWAAAWRQCRRHDFVPKIATVSKAILFPSAVNALGGNLADGLTCEVWWSPRHPFTSSLTGESAQDLCDAWTKETGKQWTQPIGFKYAGIEIAIDALKRARSLDKNRLRDAVARTDLDTIVGRIKYNQDHYAETPLVGGQWVKGQKWPWELEIVYNAGHPEIRKTAEMVFPIPGA
ncbi:MAG: ABC transporter substrate-binding protein [Desulfomonilaceae bacterium]|nr:ABC transporter substrate-binding protein [Desulfomonilaceae bacterium]